MFWQLNCILKLNWITCNRTVYLYKNGLQRLKCHRTQTNKLKKALLSTKMCECPRVYLNDLCNGIMIFVGYLMSKPFLQKNINGNPYLGRYGVSWQWRGTPHSPKLMHYWNLAIKLFSNISNTLVGGVLPLCRKAVDVINSPSRLCDSLNVNN